jgi:chitin synthase
LLRLRWDMIAWMICECSAMLHGWAKIDDLSVYILAIPVFSFFLPLYSFWKMDDFSWGSTRLGECPWEEIWTWLILCSRW